MSIGLQHCIYYRHQCPSLENDIR